MRGAARRGAMARRLLVRRVAAGGALLPYAPAAAAVVVDFVAAQDAQQRLVEQRRAGGGADALLLAALRPVYTLGRRSARAATGLGAALDHEDLAGLDAEFLRAAGASVVATQRGGQVTYHGPGQLVGYPVLDLRRLARAPGSRFSPRQYPSKLEQALVRALAPLGIAAYGRSAEGAQLTGVWTGPRDAPRKLAAIGVQISGGVTSHGFALNVTREPLRFFRRIVACGMDHRSVSCVADHMPPGGADSERLERRVEELVVEELKGAFSHG